jgi:hypothetical protein
VGADGAGGELVICIFFFRDTNLITYLLRWVYVIYN